MPRASPDPHASTAGCRAYQKAPADVVALGTWGRLLTSSFGPMAKCADEPIITLRLTGHQLAAGYHFCTT